MKHTPIRELSSTVHPSWSVINILNILRAYSGIDEPCEIQATDANGGTRKRLALAIIDYLNTCLNDGSLPPDDRDSIEVATNCIAESFHVDASDATEAVSSGQNLLAIYSTYEKLRGKSTASTQGSSAAEGRPATPSTPGTKTSSSSAAPGTAKNAEAENLKGQGNVAMQAKKYDEAIELYSRAIEIQPTNPIYLSNRAAAYSATRQHEEARQDAELAVAADPKYTKAWSRLGLARYALGDAKGSMEAYKNGIDAEGNGGSEAMKKGYETAKKRAEELGEDDEDDEDDAVDRATGGGAGAGAGRGGMPDLSSLAGMFGGGGQGGGGGMPDLSSLAGMFGGGGQGGGGGMPDIGALMQNPMMRQMAQNLMSNPDTMSNLMNNPRLREMAGSLGGGRGGGGMPDMASLMSDPSIAEM